MNLVTLQTNYTKDLEQNLNYLENLINSCENDSLILAPELALSGYSYDNIHKVAEFSKKAIKRLKKLSKNKAIALTLTIFKDGNYYNRFYMFYQKQIIHTQDKYRLFKLGNEQKYFSKPKNDKKIKFFKIGQLKVATLICFELRFTKYWNRLKGADIILVPAMWGKGRKEHFETLVKALAISNQCFVIASNSADDNCCKSSSIINPFGEVILDDSKELLQVVFDKKQIRKIRKFLDVGIDYE
ncbi:carbon-nitrogen hydrolase family protein [Malaciobacter marinus]|uniref:carbon-nitrogen hydrolase family protein n=1 Tax=Malaciobacter marinus TaxID=505249 RepID=UPI003B0079C6